MTYSQGAAYSELRPSENIENNQLNFHLKQLQKDGLIVKKDDGYTLTIEGKKFVMGQESETSKVLEQGKLLATCVCFKRINNENHVLFYTRKKHPQYGFQGFPAGKIQLGENPTDAADRELKEETNLNSKSKLVGIVHECTIRKESEEILADRYLFLCRFDEPAGELVSGDEGEYGWYPVSKVKKLITKPFAPIDYIVEVIEVAMKDDKGVFYRDKLIESDEF